MHDPRHCRHIALRLIVVVSIQCLVAIVSHESSAQPFKVPFADTQKMFGEDSEEDRKALEKIEVSMEEERLLGKQILQAELASLKESGIAVEKSGRDVDYLKSLVATLQPHMRNHERYKTIDVLVVRTRRIDARSCPGGTLLFYEGLLDGAGSEAALAGIVGHELSHLDRGHQLLPIRRQKMMEKSLSSPQNLSQFLQSGPGMTRLWARPFRPEDERDADRDGVEWSYAAGYDPREMAKLFQKKGAKTPSAEGRRWARFYRSHPYTPQRHQAVLDQYKQLAKDHPPMTPLFVGKENLANRFSRQQTEEAAK